MNIRCAAVATVAFAALVVNVSTETMAQSYQRYPSYARYCMDSYYDNTGPVMTCMFETMQQCLASRANRVDRCYLNPAFATERPRGIRSGG